MGGLKWRLDGKSEHSNVQTNEEDASSGLRKRKESGKEERVFLEVCLLIYISFVNT